MNRQYVLCRKAVDLLITVSYTVLKDENLDNLFRDNFLNCSKINIIIRVVCLVLKKSGAHK
jgi:hypothetical protein